MIAQPFRNIGLLCACCLGLLGPDPHMLRAGQVVINTEDFTPGTVRMMDMIPEKAPSRTELRQLRREERLMQRIEHRLEKISTAGPPARLRGLSDNTDKWFWMWAIGWGLGILLMILSGGALTSVFLGILWILGFVGGSAALIVWLIKRHGD